MTARLLLTTRMYSISTTSKRNLSYFQPPPSAAGFLFPNNINSRYLLNTDNDTYKIE